MGTRHHLTVFLSWTAGVCLIVAYPPARAAAQAMEWSQASAAGAAPATAWPCRLVVADQLLPHVKIVWQRSATFRQQCASIARAGATVLLRTATSLQIRRPAQARIGVSADGVTVARVLVQLSADSIEHLGHELEHVLEYLEKMNLRKRLADHRSGVTVSGVGYETGRAIDAGTRVAREVRESWRTCVDRSC